MNRMFVLICVCVFIANIIKHHLLTVLIIVATKKRRVLKSCTLNLKMQPKVMSLIDRMCKSIYNSPA